MNHKVTCPRCHFCFHPPRNPQYDRNADYDARRRCEPSRRRRGGRGRERETDRHRENRHYAPYGRQHRNEDRQRNESHVGRYNDRRGDSDVEQWKRRHRNAASRGPYNAAHLSRHSNDIIVVQATRDNDAPKIYDEHPCSPSHPDFYNSSKESNTTEKKDDS